jgi:adenine C2-methylase RlmN of 23S rRNA A2503 and tRNA A37
LNGTTDDVRNWIMPVNRKHNIEELMQALREEFPRGIGGQEKVFFEYVMLRGVNDSIQDAQRLLKLTAGVPCKINLIPFNAHEGSEFASSDREGFAES